MIKKITLTTAILAQLIITVVACAPVQNTRSVEIPTDISETSLPITENILLALERNDYDAFSRDFNPEMSKAITKSSFENLYQAFQKNLGILQSIAFLEAESSQGFIAVHFKTIYEKNSITVRLVLTPEEPYKVTGLWFPDFPVK